MKARELKKILNDTGYIVHETSEHICIGSPLCQDLISIRKDNLQLRYALDTFREGKKSLRTPELILIWEKLEQLISASQIQGIIHGEDVLENPLPVFTHDENYQIVSSFTDKYGWPNTDIKGRLMYDNTWFATEKEAIERAISECESAIRWRTETLQEKRLEIEKLEEKIRSAQIAKARLDSLLHVRGAS